MYTPSPACCCSLPAADDEVDASQVVAQQATAPTATANDGDGDEIPAAAGSGGGRRRCNHVGQRPAVDAPDNPIALPSLQIVGAGAGETETRY